MSQIINNLLASSTASVDDHGHCHSGSPARHEPETAHQSGQDLPKPEVVAQNDAEPASAGMVTRWRGDFPVIRKTSRRSASQDRAEPRRHDTGRAYDEYERELQRRIRRERDHSRDLAKDVESLKEQLRSSQANLADASTKLRSSDKAVKTLQKEKDVTISYLNDQVAKQARRAAEVEERNWKQEEELRKLRERLRVSEDSRFQMAKLLEERTSDLRGFQTFLTTADIHGGAEIIEMVESLNTEIFQTAALISEFLVDESMVARSEERFSRLQEASDIVRPEIGTKLCSHLSEKSAEVRADPLPLQLAIQKILTSWCVYNTKSFCDDSFGSKLHELYRRIQLSEAQAVAGRWRAITSMQMRDSENLPGPDMVLKVIIGLLTLSGWSMSGPKYKKSISTIQEMVSEIEKMYIQLKTAMKEGVTTADMEVFAVKEGAFFDETMEDMDAPIQIEKERQRVLCTVAMGLRRSMKRVGGGEPTRQVDLLLKPKVALVSVLHDPTNDGPNQGSRPQKQDGK